MILIILILKYFRSFKLTVEAFSQDTILDSKNWPGGVEIKRWWPQKNKVSKAKISKNITHLKALENYLTKNKDNVDKSKKEKLNLLNNENKNESEQALTNDKLTEQKQVINQDEYPLKISGISQNQDLDMEYISGSGESTTEDNTNSDSASVF